MCIDRQRAAIDLLTAFFNLKKNVTNPPKKPQKNVTKNVANSLEKPQKNVTMIADNKMIPIFGE